MGPLELPFQADMGLTQIMEFTDTGNNLETDLIIAIVFSRTSGHGKVAVRATDASGDPVRVRADLSAGESAKALVIPVKYFAPNAADPQRNGVWIESATDGARFSVLLASMS